MLVVVLRKFLVLLGSHLPVPVDCSPLKRAQECLDNGERYEIHRVYYIDSPKKRGRNIIPVEKLFSEYDFEPISYRVVRKDNHNP